MKAVTWPSASSISEQIRSYESSFEYSIRKDSSESRELEDV